LKVILIGPVFPFRGGIAHHTTQLARAFESGSHEVKVVSFHRQYPGWLYPGNTDRDPSDVQNILLADFILDSINPITWLKTASRIIQATPELAIFQWWTTFWAPAYSVLLYLLRRKGIRILFIIHNVLPHETRPWDSWITRLTLRMGDSFLIHSESQSEILRSLIPGARMRVSPLPIFDSFAGQRISQQEAKQRLGLFPDRPVLLFFGIIRPYKGLKIAIEALARIRERSVLAHLIIAGEFWEETAPYLEMIESLNLQNQVTLENRYIRDEELGLYFSAADVFLAPYLTGTQSGALKIAMGFDLPIAATDPVADTLFLNYPLARVVRPGEIEQFTLAVLDLLNQHPAKRGNAPEKGAGWRDLVRIIEQLIESDSTEQNIKK
jgi:glycosyltransferase involved in cell wall biosynthesis